MLFLLKRDWRSALAALAGLVALGAGLRGVVHDPTPFDATPRNLALGVAACALILISDVLGNGLLWLLCGDRYRDRCLELAGVFRGQSIPAILAGSLMAGLGEELVFRGLGTGPVYLVAAAFVFGALHYIRRSLWPFTVWACYEGLLFAAALMLTGSLCVTMTAHFLHDLVGFLVFRYVNRLGERGA